MLLPIAAIIVAESLATGRPVTGWFHQFESGKISQFARDGGATGLGVGLGVGRRRAAWPSPPGSRSGSGAPSAGS